MIQVSDSKVMRVHVINAKIVRGGKLIAEVGFHSDETPLGKIPVVISTDDDQVKDAVNTLFDKMDEVAGKAFFRSVGAPKPTRKVFEL